jgi:hypothetical protein
MVEESNSSGSDSDEEIVVKNSDDNLSEEENSKNVDNNWSSKFTPQVTIKSKTNENETETNGNKRSLDEISEESKTVKKLKKTAGDGSVDVIWETVDSSGSKRFSTRECAMQWIVDEEITDYVLKPVREKRQKFILGEEVVFGSGTGLEGGKGVVIGANTVGVTVAWQGTIVVPNSAIDKLKKYSTPLTCSPQEFLGSSCLTPPTLPKEFKKYREQRMKKFEKKKNNLNGYCGYLKGDVVKFDNEEFTITRLNPTRATLSRGEGGEETSTHALWKAIPVSALVRETYR